MRTLLIVAALIFSSTIQAAPISPGVRVHQLVAQLHTTLPPDWNFIMLNEGQWRGVGNRDTNTAFSHLPEHLTYVRESYAIRATDKELLHTLAHELGHYRCNCADESKADHEADKIISDSR